MKHWFFVFTIVASLAQAVAAPSAHAGSTGLGVIAGDPTGVSLKTWIDGVHAVDGAIGWSLSGNSSVQFHADFLWHNFRLLRPSPSAGRFPVFYGIGGRVKLWLDDDAHHGENDDDALVGVRFPVGVAWVAPSAPVDVFLEIVPVLDLFPDTDLDLDAAIGVRFWFR